MSLRLFWRRRRGFPVSTLHDVDVSRTPSASDDGEWHTIELETDSRDPLRQLGQSLGLDGHHRMSAMQFADGVRIFGAIASEARVRIDDGWGPLAEQIDHHDPAMLQEFCIAIGEVFGPNSETLQRRELVHVLKEHRIVRTGDSPLVVHGDWIRCSAHHDSRDDRWHAITLYRSESGKYVVVVSFRTHWDGEANHVRAFVATSETEVARCLRNYDPLCGIRLREVSKHAARDNLTRATVRDQYEQAVTDILREIPDAAETIA